jgi:hypothetical protein
MAANPSPTRITSQLWDFWQKFDALEPTALLGGIYADKGGYHNYRNRLPKTDYSTGRDLAADKLGPGDKACAIDLTMSAAAMVKYTKRLDAAARARDPRLYMAGKPILREFIGTKDSKTSTAGSSPAAAPWASAPTPAPTPAATAATCGTSTCH